MTRKLVFQIKKTNFCIVQLYKCAAAAPTMATASATINLFIKRDQSHYVQHYRLSTLADSVG